MLKELTEAFGVSGCEEDVRILIKKNVEKYADRLFEDDFGNLYVIKGKKGKKIMLMAHMDEVGFMVCGIERNGLLRFRIVGGIDPRVLPGKRVHLTKNKISGVIGIKPSHLAKEEELKKVISVENLFIDIGVESKEGAEKILRVGEYGVFNTLFKENGDVMMGKAFDDRLGCYVLTEIIKRDFDTQIIAVFTVQEEVGLRGARIAGYRLKPDCALAIEVTSANDQPSDREKNRSPLLRRGPVITITDQSVFCDRDLTEKIIAVAEAENIPYQLKPPMVGGTDAGSVHLQHTGIKSAVISLPARYIHSPCAIATYSDLRLMNRLLPKVIDKIIKEVKCN